MRFILLLTAVFLAGCLGSGGAVSKIESAPAGSNPGETGLEISGLNFHTSYEEGLVEARATGKRVLLYFRSDTCPWCLKFENEVLPEEKVSQSLKDNFALVAIDVYDPNSTPLLGKYRVQGTPTMLFLNSKGETIYRAIGFQDESRFLGVLDAVLKK